MGCDPALGSTNHAKMLGTVARSILAIRVLISSSFGAHTDRRLHGNAILTWAGKNMRIAEVLEDDCRYMGDGDNPSGDDSHVKTHVVLGAVVLTWKQHRQADQYCVTIHLDCWYCPHSGTMINQMQCYPNN